MGTTFIMLHGMPLFLLQFERMVFKEDNPVEAWVIGITIGVAVVITIIYYLTRSHVSRSVVGGGGGAVTAPRRFRLFAMRRLASAYGLKRKQRKLLDYIFRIGGVSDPEATMRNSATLDRLFKNAYRVFTRSGKIEENQERIANLFYLRNIIEAIGDPFGSSTGGLAANNHVIINSGRDSHHVRVLSSQGQNLVTEHPKNALGTPVRFNRGSRISLSVFDKSNSGFTQDAQITGTGTSSSPGLQIALTGRQKPLTKRKSRRRDTNIRCEFFLVNLKVSGTGRRKKSSLVVDNRRFLGNIMDISVGGCALKAKAPVPVGSRMKINIGQDRSQISVLGQVLRTNRSGLAGVDIHIRFLKVPRRAFNSINSIVFRFDDR